MKLKSSEPFWLVKNGIISSYPSVKQDLETDILIVGGGITGSLIAHQCIQDGYKVVLCDRREIAHGSTSASTSMLQYEIDTPLYRLIEMIGEEGAVTSYQACFEAIGRLGEIAASIRSHCGFEAKQSLYFAAFKKDLPWLEQEFEARLKYGFPVHWLSEEVILSEYGMHKAFGGILSEQGASVDIFTLTHDLLRYNIKKGLEVYDQTDIVTVKYKRNGIEALTEFGNKIKAKKIIYCNGFESTELIKESFVRLLSTYAIVGECFEGDEGQHLKDTLFWNTADPYLYMRTTDDNRLLLGGGDEDFVNAQKRDHLINVKEQYLKKQLGRLLPDYEMRTDFAWAGAFGATKDGLPYIGPHPDFKNAFFVLGFGGNGITFSVTGMQMLSDYLQGKHHPLNYYFRFRR